MRGFEYNYPMPKQKVFQSMAGNESGNDKGIIEFSDKSVPCRKNYKKRKH